MLKIGYVNEVQGQFIRQSFGRRSVTKAVDPEMYRQAHELRMRAAGIPVHDSAHALVMEVNHNRWNPMCPECNAGVCTGRNWKEARCFGCGAIFRTVVWPEDIDAIEKILHKRPPKARHWKPHETIAELFAQNIQHGVFEDLRKELPDNVRASLGRGPLLLTTR